MSVPLINYVGSTNDGFGANPMAGDFVDQHEPIPGKSEWGMDTLMRTVRGLQTKVVTYATGLAQGATYTFNGHIFYLQTWEPDGNPVFPGFTLNYKGLIGGIPSPKAEGQNIEQSVTISASTVGTYKTATREIRYVTRQTNTRYVTATLPTAPSYGVDVDGDIFILQSVIKAEDSDGNEYTFAGADAPSDLVTALTPGTVVRSFPESSPVVGSPYYENKDCATKLFIGS